MRSLMTEVAPMFERDSGAKVAIEFRLTSVLQKEIEAGAVFDVALLPRPELEELERQGKIAGGIADVARSTVGLAIRAGAPKPDIETVETFKRALLDARSIAYSDGPSGAYIADLLKRLGIADAMKAKTILTSRPVAELVAAGEAELGLQQIVAILPVKGAELVGPLPAELQNVIVYAAGIAAGTLAGAAQQSAAVRDLIGFMATPAVAAVIRAKGLEPG